MTFDLKAYSLCLRLTDGAWGTELAQHGLEPGQAPELLNATNRAAVEAVAAGYVRAGSDVILTNSFGANRFVFARHGLAERTAELATAAAAISRAAVAGTDTKVFGSIGPTGRILMMGEVEPQEISEAFAETASALIAGGVDAIVLETFNELSEIELAIRAVKAVGDVPVVASMTFASGPDKAATLMGNSPEELAAAAKEWGADAIGANCGLGPGAYVPIARRLRAASDLPVWIKANAGLPQRSPDGRTVFPMTAEAFAAYGPKLASAGASFIGGCCGTTPEFIAALRAALD